MAVSELEDIFERSDSADLYNGNAAIKSEDVLRRVSFAKKQLSTQLTAVAADYLYKKQAKPKVRRRVNFECIDKVIKQVGDMYSLKLTLNHVKTYLDANDLLFPNKTLEEMWAEADFKRNGCLEPDELRAAVSGRYKHRRFNNEWVALMCTLLKTDSIYYPDQRAVQEEKDRRGIAIKWDNSKRDSSAGDIEKPNRAEGVKVDKQGQSEASINESIDNSHDQIIDNSTRTQTVVPCFGFESQERFRYYSASLEKLGEGPSHDDSGKDDTHSMQTTAGKEDNVNNRGQWTTAIRTIRTTDKRDCLGLQIDLKPLSQVEREAKVALDKIKSESSESDNSHSLYFLSNTLSNSLDNFSNNNESSLSNRPPFITAIRGSVSGTGTL